MSSHSPITICKSWLLTVGNDYHFVAFIKLYFLDIFQIKNKRLTNAVLAGRPENDMRFVVDVSGKRAHRPMDCAAVVVISRKRKIESLRNDSIALDLLDCKRKRGKHFWQSRFVARTQKNRVKKIKQNCGNAASKNQQIIIKSGNPSN